MISLFPNIFHKENEYTYLIFSRRKIRSETFQKIKPMIDNIFRCLVNPIRTREHIRLANRQIEILRYLIEIHSINSSTLQSYYMTINYLWGRAH